MLLAAIGSGFVLAFLAPILTARLGRRIGWALALLPTTLAVYLVGLLTQATAGQITSLSIPWVPALGLALTFRADGLSLLFAVIISGVGALVMIYAGAYLEGHRDLGRFYAWLLNFMAAMLGVALADNLLMLFVFWELTSLSSYMLIGFGHDHAPARGAALQALLVTGGGGLALLAGLILLGIAGGSWEISTLLGADSHLQAHSLYVPATVLVLVGAFTKSAQFPFHFWLPAAMEAPTPVSAYLHSATMVKAGIYLLLRFNPLLGGTELWTAALGSVGLITMLWGSVAALAQTDLKRLLAYSTLSALGLLTLLIGIGSPQALEAAVVLLLAHALYKGALFLVAGIVDHETGTRDVTRLGGLARRFPLTAAAGGIAALSMAGLPPLFGFVSKELIYEAALEASWGYILAGAVVAAGVSFVVIAGAAGLAPFVGRARQSVAQADAHDDHSGWDAGVRLWLGPVILAGLSLVLGLVAGATGAFVNPAIAAALGETVAVDLALWHGVNPALLLSLVTVAAGAVLFAARAPLRTLLGRLRPGFEADLGYERAITILNALARFQTWLLQNSYLRYYLMMIVAATLLLVGGALVTRSGLAWPTQVLDIQIQEAALGILILIAALAATASRSRLVAIAALGAAGFGVSLIFLWYGAPDLAMTQFLIESLTVILFVLVFYHLPHFAKHSSRRARARDIGIAALAGALMTALMLTVLATPLFPTIADFYGDTALTLGHGRNVVNVILVDFRGFDTLGEITVLGIAATGVYALLKLHPRQKAAAAPAAAAEATQITEGR